MTFSTMCDIVMERMEDIGLFFMLKFLSWYKKGPTKHNSEILSGGGSRAHKNYTGMYGMQTT